MHARCTIEETQFPHVADQSETVSMRAPNTPQTVLEWIEEGTKFRVEEDKKKKEREEIIDKKGEKRSGVSEFFRRALFSTLF